MNSSMNFDDFIYEVVNGNVVIMEYQGDKRTLIVPSHINGCPVIEFNMCEFGSDTIPFVAHIILPGSIQRFDFGCHNWIKTVRIEAGCTDIPNRSFAEMKHLELVDLPDTVKKIGQEAFRGCTSLKYIRIPEECLSIGDSAFAHTNLVKLLLPKSVVEIGKNPFFGSENLILYLHPENQHFTLVDEMVLYTSDFTRLIRCYPSYPNVLNVPRNLEMVDPYALMGCKLYGFNIPEECKAFEGMALKHYLM